MRDPLAVDIYGAMRFHGTVLATDGGAEALQSYLALSPEQAQAMDSGLRSSGFVPAACTTGDYNALRLDSDHQQFRHFVSQDEDSAGAVEYVRPTRDGLPVMIAQFRPYDVPQAGGMLGCKVALIGLSEDRSLSLQDPAYSDRPSNRVYPQDAPRVCELLLLRIGARTCPHLWSREHAAELDALERKPLRDYAATAALKAAELANRNFIYVLRSYAASALRRLLGH